MSKYLNLLVAWIARAHDFILTLNDSFETNFSDKQLHFLVIGAIGLMLMLLAYPVFRWLVKRGRVLAVAWIYVFTVLVVLTCAIEIGQTVTGTGSMDFADVAAGLAGFFAVTAGILALRLAAWCARALAGRGGSRRRARRKAAA